MKATQKQINFLKKLNPAYTDELLASINSRQASRLIGILLDFRKAWKTAPFSPWHYNLIDVFYDAETEIFGKEITPAEVAI